MGLKRRHGLRISVAVALVFIGIGVAIGVLALWPLSTYQGVDYQVVRHTIPAYVKAMAFVTRDWHYRELTRRIVADRETQHDRVKAIYEWTRQHIKPVPQDFPAIDDHIWHIIVRGYGTADQQADVFTTLCVYAGIPAFWRFVRPIHGEQRRVFSFVRLTHDWAVFAVAEDWMFQDAQGRLLTLEQLQQMPEQLRHDTSKGIEASAYISHLFNVKPLQPLRAHQQMPWKRLRYELKTWVLRHWK